MKIDHPAVLNEQPVLKHIMNEDMRKEELAGHKPHHEHFKAHAAGHKLHHEHVASFCGGGMTKGKK
jgi:hypothetical protein